MFLTTDQLLRQLDKNLGFAESIDIATAWATSGPALDMLFVVRKRGAKIRAIVGTSGNATEPDALDQLNEIGTLRLGVGSGNLFHPKVLIFRGTGMSCAWIGSANFTKAGFASNEEIVHETNDIRAASLWFETRWRVCGKLPPNALEDYRRRWTLNRPSSSFRKLIGTLRPEGDDRLNYIRQARDWSGFVEALSRCQEWWNNHEWNKHHKCTWSVFGKTRSWVHTIEKGLPIARSKNWSELPKDDARILLGLYGDGSLESGLLGTMKGAGIAKNVFLESTKNNIEIREKINKAVNKVVVASASEFPGVAVHAVEDITQETGFSIGVATRLLALARPDRIVSINGAAKKPIKKILRRVGRRDLSVPKNYGRLLSELYLQPWFNADEPKDEFELRLWSMRAALLDSFVYSP